MDIERIDVVKTVRESDSRSARLASSVGQTANPVALAIDLCSGLGGLSLAARELGMAVVAGVDTDRDSLKTFSHNFPNAVAIKGTVTGTKSVDACKTAINDHPDSQRPLIVLSGPPCQGFSAAGSRDPTDKRNKVLLGVARGISTLQPLCALVENVEELLTDKHRRRLRDFEGHLRNAGYRMMSVKLNAKDYGVPQNRYRAFFLITRQQLKEQAVTKRLTQLRQPEISCGAMLEDLPAAEVRGAKYDDSEDALRPIPNHLSMRHSQQVQDKIRAIPIGGGPMSYRKLDPAKLANTLFSGHRAPPAHYRYSRSITVREAARLQGFPDDFVIRGPFANQMQQVTNAVPLPLARAALQALTEFAGIQVRDG